MKAQALLLLPFLFPTPGSMPQAYTEDEPYYEDYYTPPPPPSVFGPFYIMQNHGVEFFYCPPGAGFCYSGNDDGVE